jgi:hypothetical protein
MNQLAIVAIPSGRDLDDGDRVDGGRKGHKHGVGHGIGARSPVVRVGEVLAKLLRVVQSPAADPSVVEESADVQVRRELDDADGGREGDVALARDRRRADQVRRRIDAERPVRVGAPAKHPTMSKERCGRRRRNGKSMFSMCRA